MRLIQWIGFSVVFLCTTVGLAQTVFNQAPFSPPLQTTIPTISFAQDNQTTKEGNPPLKVDISLSQATNQQVSVFYTTSGGAAQGKDYALRNGLITFAPGQITQSLYIPVADDSASEGDESLTISLSGPQNAVLGQSMTTITIQDNDKGGS